MLITQIDGFEELKRLSSKSAEGDVYSAFDSTGQELALKIYKGSKANINAFKAEYQRLLML